MISSDDSCFSVCDAKFHSASLASHRLPRFANVWSLWTRFDGYLMKQVFYSLQALGLMLFNKILITLFFLFVFIDEGCCCAFDGDRHEIRASPITSSSAVLFCCRRRTLFWLCASCAFDSCLLLFMWAQPNWRNMFKTFLFLFAGSLRTSLLTGSTFNVTWHLAYPHRVSRKRCCNIRSSS